MVTWSEANRFPGDSLLAPSDPTEASFEATPKGWERRPGSAEAGAARAQPLSAVEVVETVGKALLPSIWRATARMLLEAAQELAQEAALEAPGPPRETPSLEPKLSRVEVLSAELDALRSRWVGKPPTSR
jgi:hypothetical protein